MSIKNHFARFVLVCIFAQLFPACSDENKKDAFEVFADVYTVKKKTDGLTVTANACYAYASKSMSSATVTPPGESAGIISLTPTDDLKYTFCFEPDSADFSTVPPVPGRYLFEAESAEGEQVQAEDYLEATIMGIPQIVSAIYHSSTISLTVKWESVSGADGIVVKLVDMERENIFVSNVLSPSATEFTIGTGGGNWISSADAGEKLLLQVQTFSIEKDTDKGYSLYNVAGIAIAERIITWAE